MIIKLAQVVHLTFFHKTVKLMSIHLLMFLLISTIATNNIL